MGEIEVTSAVLRTVIGFAGIIVSLVIYYRAFRNKPVLKVPDPSFGDPAGGYQGAGYDIAGNSDLETEIVNQ